LSGKGIFEYSDTLQVFKSYGFSYQVHPNIDGKWVPSLFYKYHFDQENGKNVKTSRHINWSGTEMELSTLPFTSIELYSYNEKNLIDTIELRSVYPHGLETSYALHIHEYNSVEQLTKVNTYSRHIGADTMYLDDEIIYKHNSKGDLEYMVGYVNSSIHGRISNDSTHFSYNAQGQLEVKEEFLKRGNGSWFLRFIYTYINYPNGQPDTVLIDKYNLIDLELDSHFEEKYEQQATGDSGRMDANLWRDGEALGAAYGYYPENDPEIANDRVRYPEAYAENRKWNNMLLSEQAYNNYAFVQKPADHFPHRPFARYYFYSEIDRTGAKDVLPQSAISIYPNPASATIRFDREGSHSAESFDLRIYNGAGEQVRTGTHQWGKDYTVADLPAGVYFYQLEDQTRMWAGRFVKL